MTPRVARCSTNFSSQIIRRFRSTRPTAGCLRSNAHALLLASPGAFRGKVLTSPIDADECMPLSQWPHAASKHTAEMPAPHIEARRSGRRRHLETSSLPLCLKNPHLLPRIVATRRTHAGTVRQPHTQRTNVSTPGAPRSAIALSEVASRSRPRRAR